MYVYIMDINLVSNPKTVLKNAKKILGDDVELKLSSRADKKYMIKNPNNGKWVHFGSIDYEDYTKHKDSVRQQNFLKRNARWANSDIYTPSYLSYYTLWK